MSRKVAIVGGSLSKFGVRKANFRELIQEAGKGLFDDVSNLDKRDVDSFFCGSAMPERFAFQSYVAPLAAAQLGIKPFKVTMRTELACATGQAAIRAAYACISAGLSEIALVLGVEKMNVPNMAEGQASMASVFDREWNGVHGVTAPSFFALCAQRHMLTYGTTQEQMALVSVKNHKNSSSNPYAHFQKEFSVEDVMNSFVISPPLKLLDCSGITDGAAALLMTSAERAREFTDTPSYILGTAQNGSGMLVEELEGLSNWYPLRRAARDSLKSARISLNEIDLAELHDCFTISEIIEYEELGFCEKGMGGRFIEEEQSYIGGKIPVNTGGGLLGCGHPLGATGVRQAIEILWQFQSKVHPSRQVDAEIGLAHNLSGDANVHSIMIYGRDLR
ncbi:MAG: beta-ketoacyl synthase N-terminal-like domain-containing protein [Candidatus Methanofastidiosia archaeon]